MLFITAVGWGMDCWSCRAWEGGERARAETRAPGVPPRPTSPPWVTGPVASVPSGGQRSRAACLLGLHHP